MERAVRGILLLCVRQKIPGKKPVVCLLKDQKGPLPVPASVYGLVLLLAALTAGVVKLEQVKETGTYLTGIFPLLFVPAAAGIMELWAEMGQLLLPILIAILPVTVLVMAAAGRTTQALTARNKKEEADHDGTAE